jgi:hypothetical protein
VDSQLWAGVEQTAERPTLGVTRADIASGLARMARNDPLLAEALAVNEAWEPGFSAKLVGAAEVLVAHRPAVDDWLPAETRVKDALLIAIDNADTRLVLDVALPHERALAAALQELLDAMERFHCYAGPVERRDLRRIHPPPRPPIPPGGHRGF